MRNLIVVIQCAGSKAHYAPSLQTPDRRQVRFVARPDKAKDDGEHYARPDDKAEDGKTWQEKLLDYNRVGAGNPLGLLTAASLYRPGIYKSLSDELPPSRLFILSAGWGLIRSDFLLPGYDITFSNQAKPVFQRKESAPFADIKGLPADSVEPVLFFGGKAYRQLFADLTASIKSKRIVFYNSTVKPTIAGCTLQRFETNRKRNWHYECAQAFLAGTLDIPCSGF